MCCRGEPQDLKRWHQILRWLMFTVNFILFCVSAVMMGYAVYLINSKWELLSHDDNIIPVIMFISFAIIMLVTTIGALGACNLSRGFLLLYIFITVLCLIAEITLIILVSVNKYDTKSFIQTRWDDLSSNDKKWLEESFECCGLDEDDSDSYSSQCTNDDDTTATTSTNDNTTDDTNEKDYPYCLDELQDWVKDVKSILLGIGIGLLIFQIGGMIVSLMILRALRNAERVRDDSYIEYSYYNNNV